VDEAAEAIAAADLARRRSFSSLVGFWCPLFEGTMRPLAVVVVDVDAEHAFEVTRVKDQQPVETLGTHSPDEALGDRVRFRRSQRRPHDPDALATEDFVEGAAVLAVAVADQEAGALLREVEAEVTRLLGDPVTARIRRAAGKPDAPARMRDEEQHVEPAQKHRLDGEEIAGDDARRLRPQELEPARPLRRGAGSSFAWASSRRMLVGDTRKPSLTSSPQIRRWPQRGFSRARRNTNSRTSTDSAGRPRRPADCRHFRRTRARCQRNSVRGVTSRASRNGRGR
jgi:hypothetical protein